MTQCHSHSEWPPFLKKKEKGAALRAVQNGTNSDSELTTTIGTILGCAALVQNSDTCFCFHLLSQARKAGAIVKALEGIAVTPFLPG